MFSVLAEKCKFLVFIVIILFLGGCNPAVKQKMLKIFFDGVPEQKGTETQKINKDKAGTELLAADMVKVKEPNQQGIGMQKEIAIYKHPPYAERECDACHKSDFSQSLASQVKELCFSCHDNFLEKAKVKHMPAEEGMCLECHNPHQSENKFLLNKIGQELCFSCHDRDEVASKGYHQDIGQEDCVECHDPHKGAEALLK